jgi:hypothetical protein
VLIGQTVLANCQRLLRTAARVNGKLKFSLAHNRMNTSTHVLKAKQSKMDDDDGVPLSQLANEAFSTVLPHTTKPGTARGPTDFSGLGAALTGGGGAALVANGVASGAGPGSTAAANGTGPGPGSDAAANGAGPGPGSDAAGARRPKVHGKLFQDPVHDAYRLDPLCALIFDTRQFQRLRNLKQLGLTYHVYVGVSVGTAVCAVCS